MLPAGVYSVRLHTEPIQSSKAADGKGVFLAIRMLYDATSAHGTLKERTASLGFTAEQQNTLCSLTERSGLVVISGPTGHGKTTLLKHVFEAMAEDKPGKNYVSFEDPPEYPLCGVKQVLISTKTVNNDDERARAYNDTLAGGMRMDPDTMMVGEIRYIEAAKASINAALTGHAVWATVHASNALAIIPRLTEMGVALKSLCNQNVLSGMIYQRLLAKLCPHCKKRLVDNMDALPEDLLNRLMRVMDEGIESVYVRGDGCEQCGRMGRVGQTVAAEVIMADQTLLKFLREDDLVAAHAYWVKDLHGMTHVAHALQLIRTGIVDPVDAEERLGVPLDFDKAVTR